MPDIADSITPGGTGRGRAEVDVVGVAWIEGTLYLRTVTRWKDDAGHPITVVEDDGSWSGDDLSVRLLLRERGGDRKVPVPTKTSLHLVRTGAGRVAPEIRGESRLDPRHADDGSWLPVAVWDLRARTRGPRGASHVAATTGLAPRPALIAGRPMVAYQGGDGSFSLDTTGKVRSVVDDGYARLREATVDAAAGDPRNVSVRMPLGGLRVHGRGRLSGIVTARPEPSPADARRGLGGRALDALGRLRSRSAMVEGTARLTAAGDEPALALDLTLPTGRWRLWFTFSGPDRRSSFVLTVPPTGAPVIEDGRQEASDPDVTVVLPDHGDDELVEASVRSVREQTLPGDRVQVVVVPAAGDGSTVGSVARARNAGLDAARGRYVVFLDPDDRLTRAALEKLVETADATGADVTVGRWLGITRRKLTPPVFRSTRLDAGAVTGRLLAVVGSHHVFRRAFVDELGLRFAEDLPAGSDVLFGAEAVLRSRRTSVLADDIYYQRFVTGVEILPPEGPPTPSQDLEAALRLAEVVTRYTAPGRRDVAMRPVASPLAAAARRIAEEAGPDERRRLATTAEQRFGQHLTGAVQSGTDQAGGLLLATLVSGDPEALHDLNVHLHGEEPLRASVDGADLLYDLPPSVMRALDRSHRVVPGRVVRHQLTSLSVDHGVARAAGWVGTAGTCPPPDEVRAALVLRDSDVRVDLPVELEGRHADDTVEGTRFSVRIDPAALGKSGRWDLVVAPCWEGVALPSVRFGSKRPKHVDDITVDATGRALGSPTTVLYTTPHGNLSVSHDDGLRAEEVEARRLAFDDDGRPQLVVDDVGGGNALRFDADVDPVGPREAPHQLPWRRLDQDEVAVRLPVPARGTLRCVVSVVHRDIRGTLHVPPGLSPIGSSTTSVELDGDAFVVSHRPEVVSE
ncbi:glycosyltransferase [Isoptericola sp. b408]|uniref:glycosyltransferase n=1 Tax=Isoptericola sp. b408 TaxID=3064653 RepID=UPI002713E7BE|nr:glycosyltransferase [Isoptericola sp. b408]MDO8152729.1 glycosyltransferase [Isoptericola sp. b408]